MQVRYQFRMGGDKSGFRQHTDLRLQSLSKFSDRIRDVKVVVSQQHNWQIVEITVNADGTLIRGEERSDELLASFNRALDRVQRQLRKYQEKLQSKGRQALRQAPPSAADGPVSEIATTAADAEDNIRIVKTKSHALKPMTAEEAALQMELLGHNFFMFFNGESEQVNVVYRRDDGDYGLIEPAIGA